MRLTEIAAADSPDQEVLRLDFSDIVRYPPPSHVGIVVLRMRAANEAQVHHTLLNLLADHPPGSLHGSLAVVSAAKYRLRS